MKECILIFTKFPSPGKVKTRLVPRLTKAQACELYKSLAESTLEKACKTGKDIIVCYYPAGSHATFKNWLGNGVRYMPQKGAGLGSRMKNTIIGAFSAGYNKALLIGCYIPGISAGLLVKAFKKLDKHDALIGPAKDGGYYLIGFKKEKFLAEVFRGIKWSTPSVFAKTMKVFNDNGCCVGISPELSDIDTAEDIV